MGLSLLLKNKEILSYNKILPYSAYKGKIKRVYKGVFASNNRERLKLIRKYKENMGTR